jgi:MFS family permease
MNRHFVLTLLSQASVGGLFLNLAPVTSELVQGLGATYADMGLVTTLFVLGQVAASMPAGYLSDQFGVKRIYVTANVGVLFVTLLLALAQNMQQILILRFFLGMMMGTQFVVGSSYLAFWSPPGKTTLYQGIYGGAFNFGIAMAFFLAAPQADLLGWRGVYLVPGIACLISTTALSTFGKEPARHAQIQVLSFRQLRRLPVAALSLLGIAMSAAWGTFVVLGTWLTEYLIVEKTSAFWLSAMLTGINVAGSGIGRILGGVVTRPEREGQAILWYYGVAIAMAGVLLLPLPLPAILTLAFLAVTLTSMGFAPSIRLSVQLGGPNMQGTAVGYVLALGMLISSSLPALFGWLVQLSGSFALGLFVVLATPAVGFLAIWRFLLRSVSD